MGQHKSRIWYTVYQAENDTVLAIGTAAMCARTMGCSESCFYSRVSRVKDGKNKSYCILVEDLETGACETYGGEKRGPFRFGEDGRADALYDAGLTDARIAGELGVDQSTVCRWRRKNGLPSHRRPGKGRV